MTRVKRCFKIYSELRLSPRVANKNKKIVHKLIKNDDEYMGLNGE